MWSMWNISIKSMVPAIRNVESMWHESGIFKPMWNKLLKYLSFKMRFIHLQGRNRGHSMVTKLDFFSCYF